MAGYGVQFLFCFLRSPLWQSKSEPPKRRRLTRTQHGATEKGVSELGRCVKILRFGCPFAKDPYSKGTAQPECPIDRIDRIDRRADGSVGFQFGSGCAQGGCNALLGFNQEWLKGFPFGVPSRPQTKTRYQKKNAPTQVARGLESLISGSERGKNSFSELRDFKHATCQVPPRRNVVLLCHGLSPILMMKLSNRVALNPKAAGFIP